MCDYNFAEVECVIRHQVMVCTIEEGAYLSILNLVKNIVLKLNFHWISPVNW